MKHYRVQHGDLDYTVQTFGQAIEAAGNASDVEWDGPEPEVDKTVVGDVLVWGAMPRKVVRRVPARITLTEVKGPKIEMLVVRDPDAGTDVTLFIDGVEVNARDISYEHVDPGAGSNIEDWREHTESVRDNAEYSTAFKKLVIEARIAHEDSQYIEGDRTPVWTFFGHWDNDRVIIDLALPGEHDDTREPDDEKWPEGLWCESGRGDDIDEARADALLGYAS